MRTPAAPSQRRRLALSLALLAPLALAACARDLALPGVPTGPTLSGFAPFAAYAGQLVRISGSHFAATASENTVHFAHASARADRLEGGALVVRVPADAGTGPITVSNRDGTSEATSLSFAYLGLGEPRRLQVASSSPILQRPRAVYPVAGDVVMDSGLYGGLVWAGNAAFATPRVDLSAAAPWLGALYTATKDALGGWTIARVDGKTGAASTPVALPAGFDVHQLVPMSGKGVLAVFGADAGGEKVATWDLATLTPALAPTAYGADSFFGAADVGDGRLAVAETVALAPFTIALAVVTVGTGAPVPTPVAGTPTVAAITTASNGLAPIGVAVNGAAHFAVVALDSGELAIADLDATTPAFRAAAVETWSPALVESIAAAPWGNASYGAATRFALATKPADGLSIGIDLVAGTVSWSVPGSAPSVASAAGPLAFVADSGDDEVAVVNLGTGAKLAAVGFDVKPRGATYAGAAAFVAAATGPASNGDLFFLANGDPTVATESTCLVRFPVGSVPLGASDVPTCVARGPHALAVAADAGTRTVWRATGGASPTVTTFAGGAWSGPVVAALPAGAVPQRLAGRGDRLVVAHGAGLSIVQGGSLAGTAPIPGVASPTFLALGFTPGGDVWCVVDGYPSATALRFTPAAIAAGGAPSASWTIPAGAVRGAVWLEDGLWIFHDDVAGLPVASRLDAGWAPDRTVPTSDQLTEVQAVSPNGRLLLFRETSATTSGFTLRFFRADPDLGFPEVGSLGFAERIEGFTFDATGERLYLLSQAPDRVIVVD